MHIFISILHQTRFAGLQLSTAMLRCSWRLLTLLVIQISHFMRESGPSLGTVEAAEEAVAVHELGFSSSQDIDKVGRILRTLSSH